MGGCLRRICGRDPESYPWHRLERPEIEQLRSTLAASLSPATANKYLAALRGVLRVAWELGEIDSDTYARTSRVKRVRGSAPPAGRLLSLDELRLLFGAPGPPLRCARDRALLALMYGGGLRVSEAIGARWEHLESAGRLTVEGKGRKVRHVYLPPDAHDYLRAWASLRASIALGPILVSVRDGKAVGVLAGSSSHGDTGIGAQSIREILARLARDTEIPHFTPHDLRRSFASHLIDATGDLFAVQELLGHANVSTTMRYDYRGERKKERAARRLPMP